MNFGAWLRTIAQFQRNGGPKLAKILVRKLLFWYNRNRNFVGEKVGKMEQAQEEAKIPTVITVTATEFQNNFSKYRKKVKEGVEIMVTANGKEEMMVAAPRKVKFSDLAGMFNGMIGNVDAKEARREYLRARYGGGTR